MRYLIILALILLAGRALKGLFQDLRSFKKESARGAVDEMVQDPACGMYLPRRNSLRKTIAGQEFFFCGSECARDYEQKTASTHKA